MNSITDTIALETMEILLFASPDAEMVSRLEANNAIIVPKMAALNALYNRILLAYRINNYYLIAEETFVEIGSNRLMKSAITVI